MTLLNNANGTFNTGLKIHTSARIVLPASIGRTMAGLLSVIPEQGLEYGLYMKGTWDPATATVSVLPDEYYLPEQEVSSATITFTEDPPGPEWNVVMHRHPAGCRTFSGVDRDSINEEFLASILYIPMWEFPDAVINIPLAVGSKLQVRASVHIDGTLLDIPDELRAAAKEKITKKVHPVNIHSQAHSVGGSYPTGGSIRPLNSQTSPGGTTSSLTNTRISSKAVDTGGTRTLPQLRAGATEQGGNKPTLRKNQQKALPKLNMVPGEEQQVGAGTIKCLS